MRLRGGLAALVVLGVSVGAGAGCKDVLGFGHLDSLADGSVGQVCDNDTTCGPGESCVDGICKLNVSGAEGGSSGGGSGSGSGGSSGSGSGGGSSSGSASSSGGSSGGDGGFDGGAPIEKLASGQNSPIGVAIVGPAGNQLLVWTNAGGMHRIGYCSLPQCAVQASYAPTNQPAGQIIGAGSYAYFAESDGLFDCDPVAATCTTYAPAFMGTGVGPIAIDPAAQTSAVYYVASSTVYQCPAQGTACGSPISFLDVDGGAIADMTVANGTLLVANSLGVTGCGTFAQCTTQSSTIMALSNGATKVAADAMHTYAAVGSLTELDGGMTPNVVAMCNPAPTGCTMTDSYTTLFTPPVGAIVTALAADSGKLYWALSNRAVYSCTPSAGGCQSAPLLFAATSSAPQYFAFDATYVYFTDETAGTVGRVPK